MSNGRYIDRAPGDLITAEDDLEMQQRIYDDIRATAKAEAEAVDSVAHADDADTVGGRDLDDLTDAITERVLDAVRAESGYRMLLKVLEVGETNVVEHDLGDCPLVDLYQLDYFLAVCQHDKDREVRPVTFYLYHTSERQLRVTHEGERRTINIEPKEGEPYRIPLAELAAEYDLGGDDEQSLGDFETDLFSALFSSPNDRFDTLQHCHSPWFEACCREERTLGSLRERGDWDELWFQMRPRKTVNLQATGIANDDGVTNQAFPAPPNVEVVHYDRNKLGLTLLAPVQYPGGHLEVLQEFYGDEVSNELKLKVLLKV